MNKPTKHPYRELIELAALFAAAGIADVFTNVLGHEVEGPSILIALGVMVAVVTFLRHVPRGRGAARSGRDVVSAFPAVPDPSGGSAESGGRLWRVRTMVEDRPGRLAVVAGAFAAVGANILTLQVHPVSDGVVDEFLVEAADEVTPRQLGTAVTAAGGGQVHVAAADVRALVDVPTQALLLARRLAGDPGALCGVLADLLGSADIAWLAPGDEPVPAGPIGEGNESIAITVGGPRRGVLVASRPRVPFTFVEFARAQAMADLAGSVHSVNTAS